MTAPLRPLLVCDKCQMIVWQQDWAALGPILAELCIPCWSKMRKATDDDIRVFRGSTNATPPGSSAGAPPLQETRP